MPRNVSTQSLRRLGQRCKEGSVITLKRWIIMDRQGSSTKSPKFMIVMMSIESALRGVTDFVTSGAIAESSLPKQVGSEEIDVNLLIQMKSDHIFLSRIKDCGLVSFALSTMTPVPIKMNNEDLAGDDNFIVAYNPLEGNNDHTGAFGQGLLFSVYSSGDSKTNPLIRSGRDILAAGLVLFSSSVVLMVSIGQKGVQEFVYDPVLGEFIAQELNVTIPVKGKYYCVDEAQCENWDLPTHEYISRKKDPRMGPPKIYRYCGSLCADTYRTLKLGGIVLHPPTRVAPTGTVRLLCEANPVAFLVRAAGGMATSGRGPTLDMVGSSLHETVPLAIGSRDDVIDLLEIVTVRRATK